MVKKINTEPEVKFSFDALYNSKRYRLKKDLLRALLDESGEYSFAEVDSLINDFMNKEVKR